MGFSFVFGEGSVPLGGGVSIAISCGGVVTDGLAMVGERGEERERGAGPPAGGGLGGTVFARGPSGFGFLIDLSSGFPADVPNSLFLDASGGVGAIGRGLSPMDVAEMVVN